MYTQKGTGGARHGSRARRRSSAAAAAPSVRWCAAMRIDLPKKVRALALRHALSAKAKDGGIIVSTRRPLKDAKTKALAEQFGKLGLDQRADHRRRRGRGQLPPRRAQHPEYRRAADRRASTSTTSCAARSWC